MVVSINGNCPTATSGVLDGTVASYDTPPHTYFSRLDNVETSSTIAELNGNQAAMQVLVQAAGRVLACGCGMAYNFDAMSCEPVAS